MLLRMFVSRVYKRKMQLERIYIYIYALLLFSMYYVEGEICIIRELESNLLDWVKPALPTTEQRSRTNIPSHHHAKVRLEKENWKGTFCSSI